MIEHDQGIRALASRQLEIADKSKRPGLEGDFLGPGRLRRLGVDPVAPPTLAVLADELRSSTRELTRLLDVLARRGDVVRVDKDLWFAARAVDDARAALEEMLAGGSVTLAAYRDRLDCGRRNAQALLEYFDREGLTLRRGDERIARRRRS